jgi:holo-[acyl-carrier protein] synthase
MIIGIGNDIVELVRIKRALERNDKLVKRVLTPREQEKFYTLSNKRKIEFLAGRFAAKEAYAKAKGTGIGSLLSFQDIEIEYELSGKPYIKNEHEITHLAISHSEQYAIANVIIESLSR